MNNFISTTSAQPAHREALESRVALAFAARLRDGSDALPHDVAERLRFARERAVATAVLQRKVAAVAVTAHGGHGHAASLSGPPSLWWRLASALPLVVLLAGLVLIEQHHSVEQIIVAAEIDSALLADELPPDAYRDPGFAEYLRSSATP